MIEEDDVQVELCKYDLGDVNKMENVEELGLRLAILQARVVKSKKQKQKTSNKH